MGTLNDLWIFLTPTAIHVQPRTFDRCEALATKFLPAIMEVFSCTSNSVSCVFIVFAIYPKLLNFTLLPCLFHRNIHPPLYFQTIPPWPLPRPSSPLRRRRLSSRLARRVVPERLLVLERTSVRTTVRLLLFLSLLLQDVRSMSLLLLPTCLPIVRRLEP